MGCDDVRRVLYFFLDGSLGDNKKRDVDQHLNRCPDCHQRTAVHTRLRGFLRRRLSRLEAPQRFKTRLIRSLRAFREA